MSSASAPPLSPPLSSSFTSAGLNSRSHAAGITCSAGLKHCQPQDETNGDNMQRVTVLALLTHASVSGIHLCSTCSLSPGYMSSLPSAAHSGRFERQVSITAWCAFAATRLVEALREGLRWRAQAAAQVPLRRQVHELQPVVAGHRLVAPARFQHLRQQDSDGWALLVCYNLGPPILNAELPSTTKSSPFQ